MIKFIDTKGAFVKETHHLRQVVKENIELPHNLFTGFISYKAFEFDKLYSNVFFEGIKEFLKKIAETGFTFYTLSPSPDKYFFKNFSKYSIAKIITSSSYDNYIDFLNEDPGNSPADALIDNSETFALYSENPVWGIIGSKDWEIGIVAFKGADIESAFLSSFSDQTVFETIGSRVAEINEVSDLTSEAKDFYSALECNYR